MSPFSDIQQHCVNVIIFPQSLIISSAVCLKTLCKVKKRGRRDFDGKIERRIGDDLDESEVYLTGSPRYRFVQRAFFYASRHKENRRTLGNMLMDPTVV